RRHTISKRDWSSDVCSSDLFVNALSNQREGHSTLLAVVSPNLPAKPDALLFNKVTIKGATQAVQMFGPAQAAVARAVVDSVSAEIGRASCRERGELTARAGA